MLRKKNNQGLEVIVKVKKNNNKSKNKFKFIFEGLRLGVKVIVKKVIN